MFKQKTSEVYQLIIPFEDIYTSVFLVDASGGKILIDCGVSPKDVDEVIVPALEKKGLTLADIPFLMLTHKHSDHCGGLERVLEINPDIKIIDSVCDICRDVEVYPMQGHTKDCIGLFSIASGTLIAGDGLQGSDVGRYKCFFECPDEYRQTLRRLQEDKRINNVIFSHAYNPWQTDFIVGRENIEKTIRDCYAVLDESRLQW